MHRCDGENRPVPQPHSAGLVAAEILPVAVGIRPEVVGAHPEPLGGGLFQLLSGDQPAGLALWRSVAVPLFFPGQVGELLQVPVGVPIPCQLLRLRPVYGEQRTGGCHKQPILGRFSAQFLQHLPIEGVCRGQGFRGRSGLGTGGLPAGAAGQQGQEQRSGQQDKQDTMHDDSPLIKRKQPAPTGGLFWFRVSGFPPAARRQSGSSSDPG